MSLRSTETRYGSLALWLHWLSAILIIFMLILGTFLGEVGGDATLLLMLRVHVAIGLIVLVLTALRLLWRIPDPRPVMPEDFSPLLRVAARGAHVLLYLTIIGLVATGIALVIQSDITGILTGASDAPLPQRFGRFSAKEPHEFFGNLMIALLVLHVLAAFYHHWVRKDDVLRSMWPGTQT
jgi:cytochrome b561